MKPISQKTCLLTLPILMGCSVHAHAQWSLVWEDEFEGNSLDTSFWSYQIGNGEAYGLPSGWGNNELQYYTNLSGNLSVSNGTLKITAREQSLGGLPYTSARIRTKDLRDFTYGRFEGRMKIPSTSGVWPAFWLLPTDSPYGGWASSGEIDIMESVNQADRIYGTIHHGAPWPNNQQNGNTVQDGTDFSQDFHTYALEWEPDTLRWYIDGNLFHTVTSNNWYSSVAPGNNRAPFDVPFHILLNVAVGGNFPGNPNGSASYPQTLEVDYIRVYERVQSPYGGSPHAIPGIIQAEDFDEGSNGQSYNDCDGGNNGGAYRDTDVDIQASTEGAFNVGWMCAGEWLEYTVDVESAGSYEVSARIASNSTGGAFRIEVDGVDLSGTLSFPATGGWQNWTDVVGEITLDAGEQVIRFVNMGSASQEYNFNAMTFAAIGGGCSNADLVEPFGTLDVFDVFEYLDLFAAADPAADFTGDGSYDIFDVFAFLDVFAAGCP
ncbi:MAG: family 16 glycosylhydrolase [Phycisphaerales bacterium]|nr:family 16 glycosylhydrolase [Phycisphaerales bacterium]